MPEGLFFSALERNMKHSVFFSLACTVGVVCVAPSGVVATAQAFRIVTCRDKRSEMAIDS